MNAKLQADDPVGVLAARGQHQDWDINLRPQSATDLEAVDVRQHDVKNNCVEATARVAGLEDCINPRLTGHAGFDDRPGGGKIVPQHVSEARIVIDDQKAVRHVCSLSPQPRSGQPGFA